MAQPAPLGGKTRRGSPAPVLIILVITLVVGIGGVLVILFPEQTGVPGLNASPTSVAGTPLAGD